MIIVIAEDVPSASRFCEACLTRAGHRTFVAETGTCALKLIDLERPDLALIDLTLPDMQGIDLIKTLAARGSQLPIIVITGDGSLKTAVEAMRHGARDFIVKPFKLDRLIEAVGSISTSQTRQTLSGPSEKAANLGDFQGFIGESEPMQRVYQMLRAAAPSRAPVFITGESGTGKEVAAEAVHALSERCGKPFVALNCSSIPRDLFESELFGHVKGSFTGAVADRDGACKQAHGGTLLLDEICEMPIDMQAKLLRFLQSGAIQPVGSTRAEKVDVRIVCATNRDPMVEVQLGRFRADLFYRLHVVPIGLPPLRERADDVVALAKTFVRRYSREEDKLFTDLDLSAETMVRNALWPGNVRQLQNILRRAIVMNSGATLSADMLADLHDGAPLARPLDPGPGVEHRDAVPLDVPTASWRKPHDIIELAQLERLAVEKAIALCDGSISKAAGFLGVSPSTIYRKRVEWEVLRGPNATQRG